MHCNVLIIGAGLAGATAGYLLRKRGKSVLLVDQSNLLEKDKLCGGLLTRRAVRELDLAYGASARRLVRQEFSSMRVLCGSRDFLIEQVSLRSLERRDLDRFALEKLLDAGGEVCDCATVRDLNLQEKTARIVLAIGALPVSFDALVVADGAASATRRCLLKAAGQDDEAVGFRSRLIPCLEAPMVGRLPGVIMRFEPQIRGYSWYIPCGQHGNIGCCGEAGVSARELNEVLRAFAQELDAAYECTRGAFLPSGADVLLSLGGAYFVGDAAGLACPSSGEGIYYALKSARLVAESITEGENYDVLMAPERFRLARQQSMKPLLYSPLAKESTLRFAHATPVGEANMAKFALRLFASFS